MCYPYNNPDKKCAGNCGRVHICRRCLEKHPVYACPVQAKIDKGILQPDGGKDKGKGKGKKGKKGAQQQAIEDGKMKEE